MPGLYGRGRNRLIKLLPAGNGVSGARGASDKGTNSAKTIQEIIGKNYIQKKLQAALLSISVGPASFRLIIN